MTTKTKPSDYIAQGWCQNAGAKNADGYVVPVSDGRAACWCLAGALGAARNDKVINIIQQHRIEDKLDELCKPRLTPATRGQVGTSGSAFVIWNDYVCPDQSTALKIMQQAEEGIC